MNKLRFLIASDEVKKMLEIKTASKSTYIYRDADKSLAQPG